MLMHRQESPARRGGGYIKGAAAVRLAAGLGLADLARGVKFTRGRLGLARTWKS
jgi:hypothetical protein